LTWRAALFACAIGTFAAWPGGAASQTTASETTASRTTAAPTAAGARIEARSASWLAVGLVDHDRMTIRVSRLADNAPVTNAAVTVKLRGVLHPATAQVDGSYVFASADLGAPGAAAVQINVRDGAVSENLNATLQQGAEPAEDKNSTRQLLWWVLNFGVCIGFLWLISRRRKAAEDSAAEDS
jgi:hypothetical protein